MARLFIKKVNKNNHEKPSRPTSARKAEEIQTVSDENSEADHGRPSPLGAET
jgi:hypothetical protein